MAAQESTNITFYNKTLYNTFIKVLSKQFKFPAEDAKKFHIKTNVNKKKCNIYRDRKVCLFVQVDQETYSEKRITVESSQKICTEVL